MKGIDEIPGGYGGGRCGETRDALGWSRIKGRSLPTWKVSLTLREREREKRKKGRDRAHQEV
jgi:hypothetical protein